MVFTDLFIKRPVLAIVVSLLILLFGARAYFSLTLRQYPQIEHAVISVTTTYAGANAELVQGFITDPIQKVMASAEGVEYITSDSSDSISVIRAHVLANFDTDKAFTNVMSKVAEARGDLPQGSDVPIIQKGTGQDIALMYIAFNSSSMGAEQITDYISRIVQPKLETINGVANAQIFGGSTFAMRLWLNPEKMKAMDISAKDLLTALRQNNFLAVAGRTKGEYVTMGLRAQTDLHTAEQFQQLIIAKRGNSLIRLQDVANVKLGSTNYDSEVFFNGKKAIFIGINATPTANPLTVIEQVRKIMPGLQADYPPGLASKIAYDATEYIRVALHEVIRTIIEATVIVIFVIFCFLGSMRSVFIPIITIPLSIIGVFTCLLILGYSINLLTLLAMVLAIGLVVDDAIVVVENIHRHIEAGLTPRDASIKGAREIMMPIIAMTITLAAVYAPIGFMSGITGTLFKEFAFTLAGAVIISGIIALTLSPMLCSKLLKPHQSEGRLITIIDSVFHRMQKRYHRALSTALDARGGVIAIMILVLLAATGFYIMTPKELAPEEDQSFLFVMAQAPDYANIDYTKDYSQLLNQFFKSLPETNDYFLINGLGAVNTAFGGVILKPWDQRKRIAKDISPELNIAAGKNPGLFGFVGALPSLPGQEGGPPVQFVLTTTGSYASLQEASEKMIKVLQATNQFYFVDSSLKYSRPEYQIDIDRDKAASLGISMSDIGETLAATFGENEINRFSIAGRSYKVISQSTRNFRLNPAQLRELPIRTGSGTLVPLETIAKISSSIAPNQLSQFQQLNAATLNMMPAAGNSMGSILTLLQKTAKENLPEGISYDYGGELRQYVMEGNEMVITMFFALIVIGLVLAAQFNSFRDTLIILFSVPMSFAGALLPLFLGASSINIYTQVGLVTLIGLITKHGILIVDFANNAQHGGFSRHDAILKAAETRLRPILMTTAAMVMGVMPLVLSSGAGSASRFGIGVVISCGMLIGTCFTLFVVPTMYSLLAVDVNREAPSDVVMAGLEAAPR